jgi:hypothetical protein
MSPNEMFVHNLLILRVKNILSFKSNQSSSDEFHPTFF